MELGYFDRNNELGQVSSVLGIIGFVPLALLLLYLDNLVEEEKDEDKKCSSVALFVILTIPLILLSVGLFQSIGLHPLKSFVDNIDDNACFITGCVGFAIVTILALYLAIKTASSIKDEYAQLVDMSNQNLPNDFQLRS